MSNVFKKQVTVCISVVFFVCACLFALAGCGSSDKADFIGEWKIANTEVTVVFSDSKFKLVGNTFDYKVDPGNKTITYSSGGAKGSAKYTFSSDKKQLTLEENGGKTTVFNKVSNNGDAEPSAGVATTPAPSGNEQAAQSDSEPQAQQGSAEGEQGSGE